jgi:hypothetical protein
MTRDRTTSRRNFLKSGAIVAAPIAAAIPGAALADDGTGARLARLEDERAIADLNRALLKGLNGGSADLPIAAGALQIDPALRAISEDPGRDSTLTLAADGLSASARHACRVDIERAFSGNSTLEQMARLQGQGSHRHSEDRILLIDYAKGQGGWQIAAARLA